MEKPDKELFDKVVKISQARGFVFNASSIYGGLRSSYDYGPLGTILKQNISKYWWESFNDVEVNIYPVDTAIIQSSDVWKSSGHLDEFTDPMVDHKPTGERFRADQVPDDLKKEDLTEPRQFNLMFETNIGPVQDENSAVYLRPETAQGIFVNFENVLRTMRAKILLVLLILANHLEMNSHRDNLFFAQENLSKWRSNFSVKNQMKMNGWIIG